MELDLDKEEEEDDKDNICWIWNWLWMPFREVVGGGSSPCQITGRKGTLHGQARETLISPSPW